MKNIKLFLKALLITYTVALTLLVFLIVNLALVISQAPDFDKITGLNSSYVSFDDMPLYVSNAFLAAEDIRYYDRPGMETRAVLKSLIRAALNRKDLPQEITVVQKLVKYAFKTKKDTFSRHLQEAFLALTIENNYNRKQILQMYVNHTAFGQGIYGISEASFHYFGKRPQDISVGEAAFLAALSKDPKQFSALPNIRAAYEARNNILVEMKNSGLLNGSTFLKAQKETLALNKTLDQPAKAFEINQSTGE